MEVPKKAALDALVEVLRLHDEHTKRVMSNGLAGKKPTAQDLADQESIKEEGLALLRNLFGDTAEE